VAALHSPSTGILDFGAVARVMADEIRALGAEVFTGVTVHRLSRAGGATVLETSSGPIPAARAVACAGLWSDRLAKASGESDDPRIIPFRGGYLRLRPSALGLVRGLIYPVPDPSLPFLGVHLTKTIHGDVWLGPTALLAPSRTAYSLRQVSRRDLRSTLTWPGTWRMARRFWRTGLSEIGFAARHRAFVAACARYVPSLTLADVESGPAGIRAQAVARDGRLFDDFAFAAAPNALHVRNAPSPAATSSLAIARVIADRLESV
jgi:2-hydroxyglutarate dehydrogenase